MPPTSTPSQLFKGLPMRPGCAVSVHIQMGHRYFVVEFDANDEVLRIKERKAKEHPQLGVYNASWWVASSHPLGTGNTLPKRIIQAARANLVYKPNASS